MEECYAEGLHIAVSANDVDSLRSLLALGANPDTSYGDQYNANSKTILHLACGKGYTDCVVALLDAGAMPDIRDKWGQMPLHCCLCCQFFDTATALLNHVGDQAEEIVNSKQGGAHQSCLFEVAKCGCVEGMKLLIGYGADVNTVNHCGTTPLMMCLGSTNYDKKKLMPAIKLLVESGADLEIKNNKGQTALQLAVLRMDMEALEYLLSKGADINSADGQGRTALILALKMSVCVGLEESKHLLTTLIRAGGDMNGPTRQSNVLMVCMALRSQHHANRLLRFFLSQGADPDVFVAGQKALMKTVQERDMERTCILLEYNASLKRSLCLAANLEPLNHALDDGQMDFVSLLILAGDEAWRDRSKSEEILQKAVEGNVDRKTLQCLEERLSGPPALLYLTIYKLRSLMGAQLHTAVPQLGLPAGLKDAVLLKHILPDS
ncbi:hypothetical protein ACOMHN_012040 [Nucella lapillus]